MGRNPCCSKEGLNRGAWTSCEDQILSDYIEAHGEGHWRSLPKNAGLKRCGKSCRLRWLNYLRPGIRRGNISRDEEELILRLHRLLGNRWSLIAGRLPGRTDNEIKNYWNTKLSKKHQKPATDEGVDASKEPLATQLHTVVRTKASRCTKVVMDELHSSTDELDTNPSTNDIPIADNNILSDFRMDFSDEKDQSSMDLLSYYGFSEFHNEFGYNHYGNCVDEYIGSSAPSIRSDGGNGIVLPQEDMGLVVEDWIVNADFLFA